MGAQSSAGRTDRELAIRKTPQGQQRTGRKITPETHLPTFLNNLDIRFFLSSQILYWEAGKAQNRTIDYGLVLAEAESWLLFF